MSAIWGRISFEQENVEAQSELQQKKMKAVYERKCKIDRYESVIANNAFMSCGHTYITKEAQKDMLPVYSQNKGYMLTADVILDNRDELMKELNMSSDTGNMDKSKETVPDGELLRLCYEKWGVKAVKKLRGLFAIAIYEQESNTVYLAVDPVSARCLYYYHDSEAVVFSTLMDPIRALYENMGYHRPYLDDFIMAPGMMPNLVAGDTPYAGIYQVKPGYILTITDTNVKQEKYFDITAPLPNCHCKNAKQYGAFFRRLYEECVRTAMRRDGNIAVSMSSGLDSASVAALASNIEKDTNIYSFTYVPHMKPEKPRVHNNILDETSDVEKILAMHPNLVEEYVDNEGKNCLEQLSEVLDIMELPIKAVVNFPNLCEIYRKASEKGAKIVLTGQTGNGSVSFGYIDDVMFELWNGHHYLTYFSWMNRYAKVVKESRKQTFRGCHNYYKYTKQIFKKASDVEKYGYPIYDSYNTFASGALKKFYPYEERFLRAGIRYLASVPQGKKTFEDSISREAMYCYIGAMETKLGLHYGILLRDATKDVRMLQFCMNFPFKYFAYKGTPRWLIRQNMRDLLPTELLDDWMRYGVQNVDCYERIARDEKELFPGLQNELKNCDEGIDMKALSSFLKKWTKKYGEETKMDQALFMISLNKFVHRD